MPQFETFVPVFRTDVVTYVMGRPQPVSPSYALSNKSAVELMGVFAEAGYANVSFEYHAPHAHYYQALQGWQEGAPASDVVPYLHFYNGPIVNAGLLADYWVRNAPNTALRYAMLEVEGEAINQGFGVDWR